MKRIVLAFILLLSSLALASCDPNCSADHEGWVRTTILNGRDAGVQATVHGKWTTTGPYKGCYGSYTGMPRGVVASPYEMGAIRRDSNGQWMNQEASMYGQDSHIRSWFTAYLNDGYRMFPVCNVDYGPAQIRCESWQLY